MFSQRVTPSISPHTVELREYIPYWISLNLIFLLALLLFDNKIYLAVLFTALPACIIAFLNFKAVLYFLPVSLFLNFNPLGFSMSEWIALLMILSFCVVYRDIQWDDLTVPLFIPFLLYFFVLVLSTTKSVDVVLSLWYINHYLLFIGVMTILSAVVVNRETILRLLALYLSVVAFNSIHVIIVATLSGKRVFGFAGVMFVDYVGIGIVFSVVFSLFSSRWFERILFLLLTALFTIALILTQTRTAWAATFVALVIIIGFIAIRHSSFGFRSGEFRRLIAILILFFGVGLSAALFFNPHTTGRFSDLGNASEADVTESGLVKNSLVTRVFIWHTAYNAFVANPVLGIGAYAFPFSSQYYYTISKYFYKLYVAKLTPHQTFIAVAVETGVVGAAAFLLLWISILRYVFKGMIHSFTFEERRTSVVLGGGVLYCMISMFTTDAWLWGHGIILFGFTLGSFFVHEKLKRRREIGTEIETMDK